MSKSLWSCAALLTLFVAVESLTCNTCEVGILGYCLKDKPVNCTPTMQCFSAVAKFSADILEIHDRGCIAKNDCKNQTGAILNVNYTIAMTCCDTDLCNRGASIQLPTTAALCAALMVIWS